MAEEKDKKTPVAKESASEGKDLKEKQEKTSPDKISEDEKIPELKPGMTIRVYQKIKELNIKGEEKERVQYFEGLIIAKKHGKEAGGTITVRKISDGVSVEKIYPLNLPTIEKIVIKKKAKTRRAKLNFLKKTKKPYKKKLKETMVASR